MPTAPNALKPGVKAPVFTLMDQNAVTHSLSGLRGSPVVVYFYPKDDTEDCTTQACDFTRRFPVFEKLGVPVLGISRLDSRSKAKFAKKHAITIPLLADESTEVSDAYGVLVEKSMYGKKFMGIVRTTFLIDAAGRIAARWDVTDVAGHADELLAAVKDLLAGRPVTPAATIEAKPKRKPATKKTATNKPITKKKASRAR